MLKVDLLDAISNSVFLIQAEFVAMCVNNGTLLSRDNTRGDAYKFSDFSPTPFAQTVLRPSLPFPPFITFQIF